MKSILFFFFCVIFFATGKGQSNYPDAIKQGDDAFNKQQYKLAISKYFAAEAFDLTKKDEVKAKVNKTFDAIEALRSEAEKAKKEAIHSAETAGKALRKAQKFIDAFYFYDDKYALILKRNPIQDEKYSFINKEGNTVFENRYENAEEFVDPGFARVKIWVGKFGECCNALLDYLIDTTGKKYKVAYGLDNLDDDIKALDLRDRKLESFPIQSLHELPFLEVVLLRDSISQVPAGIGNLISLRALYINNAYIQELSPEVGQLKKLQTLSLFGNRLKVLPPEIGQLKNLQILILDHNLLTSLPNEIFELKNLKKLHLTGNEILNTEIDKIKKLLPNCKIITD